MIRRISSNVSSTAALAIVIGFSSAASAQAPMGSEFTYQGMLNMDGGPLNDTADFEFTLWDADTDGNMIGSAVDETNVLVVDGVFTVDLDFGVMAFNGDARWLEISVASPTGGTLQMLSPRQSLTATPYALQTRGLYVDDADNVGIGTTSPNDALEVNGDLVVRAPQQNGAIRISPSANGFGVNPELVIQAAESGGGNNAPFHISRNAAFQTSDDTYRYIDETIAAARILFNNNGSVSFGYADAAQNSGDPITFTDTLSIATDGTVTAPAFIGDGSGLTNLSVAPGLWSDAGLGNIYYNNGHVGIGTANPDDDLDISRFDTDARLIVQRVQNGSKFANISATQNFAALGYRDTGTFRIGPVTTTTDTPAVSSSLVMDGDGHVGIGTDTPSAALGVEGDIRFGTNQSLHAVGAPDQLLILHGTIQTDGTVTSNLTTSGITAQRLGTGTYQVDYPQTYSVAPTPAVTAGGAPNQARYATLFSATTSVFKVQTHDENGALVDAAFTFVVIAVQ